MIFKRLVFVVGLRIFAPCIAFPVAYAAEPAKPSQTEERFQHMQTMMDQAMQTKSSAERQKIMGEHMKLMQEQMGAMHSMMGGDGMMGQSRENGTNRPMGPQMMQQRVDMMEQMMEQMMQEQQLMMKPAQ